MHRCGGRDLGHLHEREHTFLNARATAGCDAYQRNSPLRRFLEGVSNFLSHDGAHGAAQERKSKTTKTA